MDIKKIYTCKAAFIYSNNWIDEMFDKASDDLKAFKNLINHGSHNGYIVVDKNHPFANNISNVPLNICRTISFYGDAYKNGNILLKMAEDGEYIIGSKNDIQNDDFVIGFDTCGIHDDVKSQNREYVKNVVLDMVKAYEYIPDCDLMCQYIKENIEPVFVYQEKGEDEDDYDEKVKDKAKELIIGYMIGFSNKYHISYDYLNNLISYSDMHKLVMFIGDKIIKHTK